MSWIMLLLLSVCLALFIALIRWRGIDAYALVRREALESSVECLDPLVPIDREIATLEKQLNEFARAGGSGTWMALFAASYHRRRVADLKRHRRWHLDEARRRRLLRENSNAVRLPQPRGSAPTDMRKPANRAL